MSRADSNRDGLRSPRHRSMVVMVAVMLALPLAACGRAPGAPSPVPSSSPASAAETPRPSPSMSPNPAAASTSPTSLHWVQGQAPGIVASADPGVDHEFHVVGWSRGYLGFTSSFVNATGKMQGLYVTSSSDGLHWQRAGHLDLGPNDSFLVVTQLVEGPSGLLATAEVPGCALHKPAVRMWRSTDGASWSPLDLASVFGADVVLPAVSGGSAGYIVLAATADNRRTVWTSQDGASWHESTVPGGGFSPASVASFKGGFILAGATRPEAFRCQTTVRPDPVTRATGSVWSSQLGSPWNEATLPGVLAADMTMDIYRLNDETVLAEELVLDAQGNPPNRLGWTSSDGLTWQQNDTLAVRLGYPLTGGARTVFAGSSDQGQPEVQTLTPDLRLVNLPTGPDLPIAIQDGSAALGPAGLVVSDGPGTISWLATPIP